MIHVSGLVFDYLGHRALHGVSVDIPQGTVTALVGPNGAGKSTLMRCIAGLDTPLAGTITVGVVWMCRNTRARFTPSWLTSRIFLASTRTSRWSSACAMPQPPRALQTSRITKRVKEVARFLNLENKLQSLSSNLSRGQRQRVAIGQAIVHMPQVLLLDEPASGLDPEARADLSALFRNLQSHGMTLVVSSHILSELDEYCTHILSIRDGRVSRFASLATTATGSEGVVKALVQVQLAAPAPQLAQVLAAF